MKHTERQHLKENELAQSLAAAGGVFARSKSTVVTVASVIGVVLIGTVGYAVIRDQRAGAQAEMLSAAMTILEAPVQPPNPAVPPMDGKPGKMAEQQPGTYPTEEAKLLAAVPKLIAVADAYPTAEAGLLARYRLAQAYVALDKRAEALAAFERVIADGGTSLHARMARLGKASTQALLGQHKEAIASYTELIDAKDSQLPGDALLMELASVYTAAGNESDAKKAYSRVVHEFPGSPFADQAGKLLQ
ncbi:MAG: tol-pal system YbgF family protein [Vicinamibacterales bacterium]